MKRTHTALALCMLLVLLTAALPAAGPVEAEQAEQRIAAEIDYEGAWLTLADQGFALYMPLGWAIGASGETDTVALVDPDTGRSMWIERMQSQTPFVLAEIEKAFAEASGLEDVAVVHFGEIPFITYTAPAEDMFGAITLSADHAAAYFFKFKPLSDTAYTALSLKIMATLRPA